MLLRSRRTSSSLTAWPGYVDVLSALLMVVIFLLMIFTIAQFLLSEVLYGQKTELARLQEQVLELAELLGLEREKSDTLTSEVSRLSDVIVGLSEDREVLMGQVKASREAAEEDKEKIRLQLLTLASLNEDISTLRKVRDDLEKKVAGLAVSLADRDQQIGVLRDRSMALVDRLADQTERTVLAQEKLETQEIRIQALSLVVEEQKKAIQEEKQLSASSRAELALLSQQLANLKAQLMAISDALGLAQMQGKQKDEKIADLGQRLNMALARKVSELAFYRSEFFGRLKKILGNNPQVQIQGDRFVFQAGLLFESGSADLGLEGQTYLTALADTLLEISQKIPQDINWILRIDGHTDKIPIYNERFASNWELSSARAVSVVRFLGSRGIPEHRMAAAGFSKYHPIDPTDTPGAYARNRRIEIKLTSQ